MPDPGDPRQPGASGPPPGVVLTELAARRKTRIAYRNGTRHHPPVSACIAAIHAAADTVDPAAETEIHVPRSQ